MTPSETETEIGGQTAQQPIALVAEDDDGVRPIFCEMLQYLGFETVAANSGMQAFELLQANFFDLLLTDVRMPGAMDGAALASAARQLHPEMMIIVVTGFGGQAVSQIPQGTPVLPKPFMMSDLQAQIEKLRGGGK